MRYLLNIWREVPFGLQLFITGFFRPRYRVAVAAIILDDKGCILLCEHTYRKFNPWGLPGGGLGYRENPEDGVKREVREETGLEVRVERLLFAEAVPNNNHISLIYLCKVYGGAFRPNYEIIQTEFFRLDGLPNLVPKERALIERVAGMLLSESPSHTANDQLA